MTRKAMASVSEMEAGSKTGLHKRISVTSIVVNTGRLICEVSVPDPSFRHTNSATGFHGATIFGMHGIGVSTPKAAAVAAATVGLAIELQTRATDNPQATFVGTTEWVDEAAGIARVQVSYLDDLQALRSLSEALDILNGIDEG